MNQNALKRVIDVILSVQLVLLMSFQLTGSFLHEWCGIAMVVTVIVHNILNIRWYGSLFSGKYNASRTLLLIVNLGVVITFVLTALSGMAISDHAVPFLYGFIRNMTARTLHLAMSYWSMIMISLHLGLHWSIILNVFSGKKKAAREPAKNILPGIIGFAFAAYGMFVFMRDGIPYYLSLKTHFAMYDYEKNAVLVLFDTVAVMASWIYIAYQISLIFRKGRSEADRWKRCALTALAVLVGIGSALLRGDTGQVSQEAPWGAAEPAQPTEGTMSQTLNNTSSVEAADMVLIKGGTFEMGSPESENWRSDDETLHPVTVSDFYISPYEVSQAEYEAVMRNDPSSFEGNDLPVDSISWQDAVEYANARSEAEGLTTAYTIAGDTVTWNRGADGYRLPTEAEWEYACRAGTATPFNSETSLSAEEANFYGHYPYEIEENYFDNAALTARPGEYRQTTVAVDSFEPNRYGLYNMHGNVNEWTWDLYGAYPAEAVTDPAGPASGTRHIYRGGGWNDFAKNMRSAYRAAGEADYTSPAVGMRLVRNALAGGTETASVTDLENRTTTGGGKTLIAYYSWGGNTRGVAEEIQRQTGADLFEITMREPYSTDYNTVLMQAQEAQHRQDRPSLASHVENMDQYDTIILGWCNWWVSIPMPVASFLEEYDFAGKTIMPFCSHGGGRFGQGLTAVAKLAPNARMTDGLPIHYSGGATMPDDVSAWLAANVPSARNESASSSAQVEINGSTQ